MSDGTSNENRGHKFSVAEGGLYLVRDDHANIRIADYIRVYALAQEENQDGWLVVIRFLDVNGQKRSVIVPRSEVRKAGAMADHLSDAGYSLPIRKDLLELLTEYLRLSNPHRRIVITLRTGWIEGRYVFPDKIIGKNRSPKVQYSPALNPLTTYPPFGGTLKDWTDGVAAFCTHSSRLMFAVSIAFANMLLKMTGVESGGFHLVGPSSTGKTTALLASTSVSGYSNRHALVTWDSTATGLDELAAAHCDQGLAIDELARISIDEKVAAAKARDTSFRLASGQGKIRSIHYGRKGNRCTWRLLFLSSGEIGISELAAAAGKTRLPGDQVRLIDIPAVVSKAFGIYESVPDSCSPAALSEQIEAACAENFGTAGRAFVALLLKDNARAAEKVERWQKKFAAIANVPANGWERQFARRFGLAYAAARLAIDFGILAWPPKATADAIVCCYRDARRAIPDFEHLLAKAILRVRRNIRHKKGLRDLRRGKGSGDQPTIDEAIGFIKKMDGGGELFLIKPGALQRWVGDKIDVRFVAERLLKDGFLVKASREILTKQVLISGIEKKRRYYCISGKLLASP